MSGTQPVRDPVAEYLALKKGGGPDPVSDYLTAKPDATAVTPTIPQQPRQIFPHSAASDALGATYKFGQGATLGLGKYLAAGAATLGDRLQGGKMPYGAALDELNDLGREYDYNHPDLSKISTVAGALATAKVLPTSAGLVSRIPNTAARLGAGLAAGTAENALYGGATAAIAQEGGFGQRVDAAKAGAISGAKVGAGIGAAGIVGSTLLNATARPSETSLLGRATSGLITPVEDQARNVLLRDMARDRTPIGNLLVDAKAAGDAPASLATLGGENIAGRTRGIQSLPGPAKQQIRSDLEGARRQLPGFMATETRIAAGIPPEEAEVSAAQHAQLASQKARPLYAKAYQDPPIDDQALLSVFQDDHFRQAYNTGRRIAATEGTTLPPLEDIMAGKTGMPVQGFDYAKQGLDDVIESGMNSGKMGRREARALRDKLSSTLGEVDNQRPNYAAARDAFRGEKELEDAATQGGDFLNMSDRQVKRALAGFGSTGERDAFRSSALDQVMQVYRSSDNPGVMLNKVFGSDVKREALRHLIGGNPKYQELKQAMSQAGDINSTANMVIGGSPSMRIAGEQDDISGAMREAGSAAFRGSATGTVLPFLRRSYNRVVNGQTERFGEAAGPMLTAGSQGGTAGLIDRMNTLQNIQASQNRFLNRMANGAKVARAGAQVAGQGAATDMHDLFTPLDTKGLPPDYIQRAQADPRYRAYLQANGVPIR